MKSPDIYRDGISITSKLDLDKMVYKPRPVSEIRRIIDEKRRQDQKPIGGVEGVVFDNGNYIPKEEFTP